jgi:modulator of FtsH protease HflC
MKVSSGVIIAVVLAAIIGGWMSFFVMNETQMAIVTEFGKFKRDVKEPGIQFKTPWEEVRILDSRILSSDAPHDELLTKDQKRLVIDPVTHWRVADPLEFYKTVNNVTQARLRLDDIVFSRLRQEIASRDMHDIIDHDADESAGRRDLMEQVTVAARENAKAYGIDIVDVQIKRTDLPEQVQESVFQRMRAERNRQAKQYRSEGAEKATVIRAGADKERTVMLANAYATAQKLRGEGDAQGSAIYADAYNTDPEFYAFTRSLKVYENTIDKNSEVFLSTSSPVFKYLNNSSKR